jgi:hypothetical protein
VLDATPHQVEIWLGNMGIGGEAGVLLEWNGINLFAAGLQAVCVAVVLCGADASKLTVNCFCIAKVRSKQY